MPRMSHLQAHRQALLITEAVGPLQFVTAWGFGEEQEASRLRFSLALPALFCANPNGSLCGSLPFPLPLGPLVNSQFCGALAQPQAVVGDYLIACFAASGMAFKLQTCGCCACVAGEMKEIYKISSHELNSTYFKVEAIGGM